MVKLDKFLLIRPFPLYNESIGSYLHRVMNENFYKSISYLLYIMDSSNSKINYNDLELDNLKKIANFTGINISELEKMTVSSWQNHFGTYYHKIIIKNRVKFCPECIKDKNYHQISWLYYQFNICLKHQLVLVERCNGCNANILMASLLKGFCPKCTFLFISSNSYQLEPESIFYQSQYYFWERLKGHHSKEHWFKRLSLSSYLILAFNSLSLLHNLQSYIDTSKKIKAFHNTYQGLKNSSDISDAFANVYWMYQDFPNHFYKVLNDFQGNKQNQLKYIQKAGFELVFENDGFAELKAAYEIYWIEQLNQGKVRRDLSVFKKDPSLLNEKQTSGIEEIETIYGFSTHKIHRLNASQPTLALKFVKGKYYKYLISNEMIQSKLLEYRSYIGNGEFARMLGIQKDSVPKLIKAGLINCYTTDFTENKMIKIQEVRSFLDTYRGKYVRGKIESIRFHDVIYKYNVSGLSIVKILEFTRKKVLNPITIVKNGILSDNYYLVSELEKCLNYLREERQNSIGYNMTEVIKLLKIGEKKMWDLVNQGIIVPDRIQTYKDDRKRYFFSKSKIALILQRKSNIS